MFVLHFFHCVARRLHLRKHKWQRKLDKISKLQQKQRARIIRKFNPQHPKRLISQVFSSCPVHCVTMRSLLTAAEISGTASISCVRSGCDVRLMGNDDVPTDEVVEDGSFCGTEAAPFASAAANDSPRGSAMPIGGRSIASSYSSDSLDQATLGSRGVSATAGATLFMFVKCLERLFEPQKLLRLFIHWKLTHSLLWQINFVDSLVKSTAKYRCGQR